MSRSDTSSGAGGKRVGVAIPAIPGGSARSPACRRAEPIDDRFAIEAEPRTLAVAELADSELRGVVVDPPAADPPDPRDLQGGDQRPEPLQVFGLRILAVGPEKFCKPLGHRLDALLRKAHLLAAAADTVAAAHRRLRLLRRAKGAPGCSRFPPPHSGAAGAQCAILAAAILV